MYSYKTDVAVLLLFFTRTAHTKLTFEQIRKARPSRLFLYQDGPREGREDDIINIKECRETIESMIDWDCEVHRMYQDRNFGCDPSEYLSQKWMFSHVDKGIIIEDDDVMAESFFPFCKELLDKYENDTRINMICGRNYFGKYDAGGADYFFTKGGSIWGWATWKRTIDSWDTEYKFIEDKYTMKCLEASKGKKAWSSFVKTCQWHKGTGKEFYESIRNSNQHVNSQMNIVPTVNMTCNIGIGLETTHSVSKITYLPRSSRKSFFQPVYELATPLNHPRFVVEDIIYQKKVNKQMHGNFFVRLFRLRLLEYALYKMFPILGRIGSGELQARIDSMISE